MKTIWKFELAVSDRTALGMPRGARILSLQTQRDQPCFWAEVDRDAERETRTFATYGTGHPLPEDPGSYVGTYQIRDGELVFHVFEVAP